MQSILFKQENDDTKKRSVSDDIYTAILQAIFERKLAPGVRLKEEELCEVFDTGRATIRTVLQKLAMNKLVNIVPNSGAFIAEPSKEEAKEVFEARRLIERTITQELATDFDQEKERVLTRHVNKEKAAERKGQTHLSIRLSGEFHLLLGELSGKKVLTDILREIIFRTSLIITLYRKRSQSQRTLGLQCHHEQLIQLMKSGESEKAIKMMDDHLLEIESQLELENIDEEDVDLKSIFSGLKRDH
ncbi:GntR family transcriptional regulator [Veronia pacifica]|uniref:HTH gntR-type domain-containing protein n=1 Tax=Veronia pacifica TaxID=1080227 RepID=A0A1C3EAK6_9GAMM|nr:GntR family transcriptional regulator [Veronia pacifica]ODA30263.1 hypothetical protein A8L45_20545 [Veronia pacifica]